MAKIIDKIVESSTAPSKNDLWLNNGQLKAYQDGKWKSLSPSKEENSGTDNNTAPEPPVSITYAELRNLIDSEKLVPEKSYRIIDYETVSTDPATTTANHYFDVVVTAESTNKLYSEAGAMHSERDVDGYFKDSDLSKWQLWYSIYNTTSLGSNTDPLDLPASNLWASSDDGHMKNVYIVKDQGSPIYVRRVNAFDRYAGQQLYAFYDFESYIGYCSDTEEITEDSVVYDFEGEVLEGVHFSIQEKTYAPGKGQIYRMIDDNGNDVPYDFKNILIFSNYNVTGGITLQNTDSGGSSSVSRYYILDKTINGVKYYCWYGSSIVILPGGMPSMGYTYVYTDTLDVTLDTPIYTSLTEPLTPSVWKVTKAPTKVPVYVYTFGSNTNTDYSLTTCSNNIVDWQVSSTTPLTKRCLFSSGCSDNVLTACYSISLGNNCVNVHLDQCRDISIPSNVYNFTAKPYSSWTFVTATPAANPGVHDITIGENCSDIKFLGQNNNIIIGDNCEDASFGMYCTNITLGDGCVNNTFNTLTYSVFGSTKYAPASNNILGNYCCDNTFYGGCTYNTLGNYCENNAFTSYTQNDSSIATLVHLYSSSNITVDDECSGNIFSAPSSSIICNGSNNKLSGSSISCYSNDNTVEGGNISIGYYSSSNVLNGSYVTIGSSSCSNTITGNYITFGDYVENVTIDRCNYIDAGSNISNVNMFDVNTLTLGNNIEQVNIGTEEGSLITYDAKIGSYCSNLNIQLDPESSDSSIFGLQIKDSVNGSAVDPLYLTGSYSEEGTPKDNTPSYVIAPNSNGNVVIYCTADLVGNSGSSGNTGGVGMINVTYAELKNLRDTSALIPGQMYRITDYETTTIQNDTRSAGNMFDVIVKALSTNKLAAEAQAIQSSRDTEGYFANCDLSTWKLWYCLDNDSVLYPWIDTENGKGVIYRMIDERNNDVPYDFKNIQFKRFAITEYTKNPNIKINDARLYLGLLDEEGSVIPNDATLSEDFLWMYTFTLVNMVDSSYLDATISPISEYGESCSNNIIKTAYAFLNDTACAYLNNIVLLNAYMEEEGYPMYAYSYNNKFGTDCANSSFGVNTCNNSFDYWCQNNIVANGFNDNKLGYMSSGNTFGNMVYANTFGHEFRSNNTGNSVYHNTFGDRCWMNEICSDFSCNIIEHEFMNNEFQDGSKNPSSHYKYNYFGPNVGNCIFVNDEEASDNNQVQHYRVAAGTDLKLKSVTLSRNLALETTVAMNTAGEIKIFNLADLVQ